jgi:hypothetical protein
MLVSLMLSITNKHLKLNVVMVSVFMLNVVTPSNNLKEEHFKNALLGRTNIRLD